MLVTSSSVVQRHAQKLGLYAINQFLQTQSDKYGLKNMPASAVLRALLLPENMMWSIEAGVRQSKGTLSDDFLQQGACHLIETATKSDVITPTHPTFIKSRRGLEETLSGMKGEIEIDGQKLNVAWQKGTEVLNAVSFKLSHLVQDSVFLFLGINNKWGEIEAFSAPAAPGFIAVGINNPPILMAEEILHESTHTYLWALLNEHQSLSDAWAKVPPIYSPFTRSPRPAVRILHGFVSYYAVLYFWESIAQMGYYGWFGSGITDDKCKRIIRKRIDVLTARLSDALFVLRQATEQSDILLGESIRFLDENIDFSRFCHISNDLISGDISEVLSVINNIERAELLLAIRGHKISRISAPIRVASLIGKNLIRKSPVIFSELAFCPAQDSSLGGFSNMIQCEKSILNASKEDEVFCYIGRDVKGVRIAQRMDVKNMAGDFYQIPKCCQHFFRMNWEKICSCYCGDSFGFLLQSKNRKVLVANKNCNVAAMYFGDGLCWHFPCDLWCEATSKLILERNSTLVTINKSLSVKLYGCQGLPLLYGSNSGYGRLPIGGGQHSCMREVQWLGNFAENKDISVEEWLNEKDITETRRLIHFL